MASYLRLYRSKFILSLFIILSVTIVITVTLNILFLTSNSKILELAKKYFHQNISVGHIFYAPPNIIILKNVNLRLISICPEIPDRY